MRKLSQGLSAAFVLVMLLVSAGSIWAQTSSAPITPASTIPSRADQLANETVSLSSDTILNIFHDSPGLVLEFKKTLVRKAYEQGRLLDPEQLTDEAVFELVRTDTRIRVLATQEIEKRSYVRAKPTAKELEQAQKTGETGAESLSKAPLSEADYWKQRALLDEQRDKNEQQMRLEELQHSQQQPSTPPSQPVTPSVPYSAPSAQTRQMLMAQSAQGDYDMPMTPINPSELPTLFAGSAAGSDAGVTGAGTLTAAAQRIREAQAMASINGQGVMGGGGSNLMESAPETPTPVNLRPRYAVQPNYAPSVIGHRPDPYADVPSLYDLYSQVSRPTRTLSRFGADVFTNGSGNFNQLPMDLPAGPDYVLGPGDTLRIDLWGGVSERLQRVVNPEGQISLPEAGTVQVAGKNLGSVQELVQAVLRTQFRDERADVSLARLRTVRIYVVGDVAYPGAYDISALSTPLNAVLAAGGPTSRGSMREVKHFRGKQLVQETDLYDLILHGVRNDTSLLQSGDTIQVAPIGPQITVEGMVRRPAIYELRGESNLAQALDMAGGVLSTGTLRHIDVERIDAHEKKVMLSLDVPETNDHEKILQAMEAFKVQDGDVIRISPILPYSYKTVYLDGHVFHPGKYPYKEGMKVTDLIRSYSDLMPEPSRRHAEIIRLNPPDYRPAVFAFNLADALDGKIDPELKPFDTVRIFGRYDFEDPPQLMISGEVRDPGEHLTNGETHIRDAVYLAGGVTPDARLDDAQVYRKLPDGEVQIFSVNLKQAMAGDPKENILLESRDRVIIHRDLTKLDPPSVEIAGAVARPGKYPLGDNMSAAQLVRLAGGFTRGAYTKTADLSRYVVENGKRVLGEHEDIPIAKAMSGEPDTDVRLMDGDVLAIRQIAGWNEVGASVKVTGEVAHPATYGIAEGERLSSVLERAGGFTPSAYPYGAVLERTQVREFAEKSRQEMIQRIKSSGTGNISTSLSGPEQAALVQASLQQQKEVLTSLEAQPASGRLVIRISPDIKRWKNTNADIEVRPGDTIFIPKRPDFVIVSGQVYNTSAVTFVPGKNAAWYLEQAGGATSLADKKNVYVIRADGSVVGREAGATGIWRGKVMSLRLQPGDTVVVPEKFIGGNSTWKEILNIAQFASSMAIAARVATSF